MVRAVTWVEVKVSSVSDGVEYDEGDGGGDGSVVMAVAPEVVGK